MQKKHLKFKAVNLTISNLAPHTLLLLRVRMALGWASKYQAPTQAVQRLQLLHKFLTHLTHYVIQENVLFWQIQISFKGDEDAGTLFRELCSCCI